MKNITLLLFLLGSFNLLFGQSLRDGLVFYAPFDGNTINLVDWVKPRNHGVTLVEDKFGEAHRAVAFDGEQSMLDYGNIVNLGERNFTISVWVKVEKDETAGYRCFPKTGILVNKGTETYAAFNLAITNAGGDNSSCTVKTESDYAGQELLYGPNLLNREWQHLVMSRANESFKFYLNGSLISEGAGEVSCNLDSDHPLIVGGTIETADQPSANRFKGALDELRIYNRALSESDIETLYEAFLGGSRNAKPATSSVNQAETIEIAAYPNPATHLLNLKFTEAGPRRIEVVDEAGRKLSFGRSEMAFYQINVAGFPPGQYFLRIQEGERTVVKKFLKQGAVLP